MSAENKGSLFPELPLLRNSLEQWSPTISAQETGFVEENISMDWGGVGGGMVPG